MAANKSTNDAMIGQTIAGRYRIISRLGVGGMGVAYRAWDEQRGVPVVIKIPKKTFLEDPKFAERFHREIRLLQGLSHPHIVPILDVGEHDGLPYVVMRFLPGGSLSNRRLRGESGDPRPNPPGMLNLWLPAVAAALDFVHASGVIHRDVKPANIFFDAFWGAYLGDFGIAKIVEESDAFDKEHTLTASQMLIGTQDYMAPEQFQPKASLDGRVDQYALAVMAYEMVSGSRPFTGKSAHLIVEVTTQPAPPLKSRQWRLPPSLIDAVQRGLAKKAAERFATCSEFAMAALADVSAVQDEPGVARLLCPQCSNVLKLPTSAAGQKGKCPKCQAQMKVTKDLGSLWLLDEARNQGPAAAGGSDAPSSGGSNATPASFAPLSRTTWITNTFRQPFVVRRAMIVGGVCAAAVALVLLWRGVSALGLLATKQPPPAVAVQAETKLQLAEKALLENPLNPTANEIVARHWCFEQGDWARGLPYLAKSGLVSVSSTARDEIAVHDSPSPDPGDLVRISQRWWKLAKQKASTNDDSAPALQKHAVELFATYVGTVADARDVAFVTKWIDSDEQFRLLVDNKRPKPHEPLSGTVAADPKASVPVTVASGTASPLPAVPAATTKSQERPDGAASGSPKEVVSLPSLRNSIGIELKLIPAGTFQMGSNDGSENEKPVHEVQIIKPFYLGVTEVTNAQWKAVMGYRPSEWKDADLPVERVPWDDAIKFCEKLSMLPDEKAAGRTYRLPTEAEWEYACRAGTQTRFSFGDDEELLIEFAWFRGNAGGQTRPVGQKKPNPWGLHDMHGNVWEWCSDWYGNYGNADELALRGTSGDSERVHRGGGYRDAAGRCRPAARLGYAPSRHVSDLGFRLALSPSGTSTLGSGTASQPSEGRREPSTSGTATAATPAPTNPEDLAAKKPEEILAIPPLKNSIGIELKLLPAGTFQMGSNDDETPNSKPAHQVRITKPFYLGVTEVTNSQWKAVMGDVPSEWKDNDRPVEQVSRDDAVAFCERLSAQPAEKAAGRVYRLPTEAEWEYACRAGTTTRYSFGGADANLREFAWFSSNADGHTHPVGEKKPNPWSLCDMHGNVSEWCSDRYGHYAADEVSDPTGPAEGSFWITRGGSWLENASSCRSASRFNLDPKYRAWVVGFRVALSPRTSDLSNRSAAKTETGVSNPKDDVQEQNKKHSPMVGPPAIGSLLEGREQGQRERLVKAFGGGDTTEAAVTRALDWLARQQGKDGLWSLQGPYVDGASQENRLAATAMSLLALQGAGNTPHEGRHKGLVAAAWTTLLKKQIAAAEGGSDAERRKSGAGRFQISLLDPPVRQALYSHAMVTIALCELYGMTKDPAYKEPARQAVAYAVAAQGRNGGWRYEPGQEGDMSVTGWYMMALKTAQMAGLEVPERTLANLKKFLDGVAVEDGSRYGYRFDEPSSDEASLNSRGAQEKGTAGPVTTAVSAEGLLCRQYLGWPREHAALAAGVAFLVKDKPVDWDGNKDVYAWYYISQVTHHMGGEAWERWNSRMKEVLPATQVAKGNEVGSWDPALDKWAPWGGRLFTTCFCTYMLEVYYRHLPLYGD